MGFADDAYRDRKHRTHGLMSRILGGAPVVEHDFWSPAGIVQGQRDRQFWLEDEVDGDRSGTCRIWWTIGLREAKGGYFPERVIFRGSSLTARLWSASGGLASVGCGSGKYPPLADIKGVEQVTAGPA